jgi:PST family polysaccharide transporter
MISKNLERIKRLARKNFIINFFSLTIFQVIELFIPLVTIPIIISRVGAEKFGLISFAVVFSYFFQLIIDFGFNTISTRDISIHKNDKNKINEIFNNTINSKLILMIFCFIIYLCIVLCFEKLNSNIEIYIFTFISLIGQSLIPIWFFQGLQESKYLTISSFLGRFSYLLLILFFINTEENYTLIPIFNSIGYFISAMITLGIIYKKYKIPYKKITSKEFIIQLNKGKFMFFSEIKLYFISYFNILILGIISGNTAVAYFVGAEKIIRAISNLFIPVQNSLFPILAIKLNNDKTYTIRLIKKILPVVVVLLLLLSILLFVFSENIIFLILGVEMRNSILVFKILSLVPLLTFLDLFFGKQILLNLKKEKEFFKVILFIAIINIPLIYFFITNYGYIGASISQLTTQFLLVIGMFYYSYKALKTN